MTTVLQSLAMAAYGKPIVPLKCQDCKYEWIPKKRDLKTGELIEPPRCANPDCRTPAWNRKRKPAGRPKGTKQPHKRPTRTPRK